MWFWVWLQISECYMKVSDWQAVQDWYCRVGSMQENAEYLTLPNKDTSISSTYKLKYDRNHHKSLAAFDAGDLGECREVLDARVGS